MSRLEDQIRRLAQVMDSMAAPIEDLIPPDLADELDVEQSPGIELRIPLGGPTKRPRFRLPGWAWGLAGAAAALVVAIPLMLSLFGDDDQPVASQPSTTLVAGTEHALSIDLPAQTLSGFGWAPNAEITVSTGYYPSLGADEVPVQTLTTTSDGMGNFMVGPLENCCDMVLEVTDGIRTLEIRTSWYLQLIRVDPATDLIAGAVDLAGEVTIRIAGGDEVYETVVTPPRQNGRWLLDLSGIFDLLPGMIVEASSTTSDITYITYDGPHIENNVDFWMSRGPVMSGWGFLPNSLIEVTIDGVPLPDQVVADVAGAFDVDFSMYGISLTPGMVISVTDGVDSHTTTVPILTFDSFDPVAGTASGTTNAPDGAILNFGLAIGLQGDENETHPQYQPVASGGVWEIQFDPVPSGWEVRDAWIMYEQQESPFHVHFDLS